MAGTLKLGGLEVFSHQDSTNTLDFSSNVVASFAETLGTTTTTGSITHGTNTLTVGSGTGIGIGDGVVGEGITPGTTVLNIVGGTVTLSANLNIGSGALSGKPFTFYKNKLLTARESAAGLCKAWVNFNGTGTVAIRKSFNVSSITDDGEGKYTVTFLNPMPDANYSVACESNVNSSNDDIRRHRRVYQWNQNSVKCVTGINQNSDTKEDHQFVNIAVFG